MFLILLVRQITQGSETLKSISSRYRFSIFSPPSVSDSLISSIFHNLTLLSDHVSRILAFPASFTICSWGTGGRTRKFSFPFTKDNTENVLSTPIISTEYSEEDPPIRSSLSLQTHKTSLLGHHVYGTSPH